MEHGLKRIYNLERQAYLKKVPFIPRILQGIIRVVFSATVPYSCSIGQGTVFPHGGQGVVLHEECVIGENCKIQANVVIGGKSGKPGAPKIGDHVLIGAGAVVLGDITIGSNVAIGSNAVITKSVPDNVIVAGVPGKIIRHMEENNDVF